MGTNGTASNPDISGALALPSSYRALNAQRIDIDRRMAVLEPDDPTRDTHWQELEAVLVRLRAVVSDLAVSPARDFSALRDKADVLAMLLRPEAPGGGPIIPEDERTALALSLTDDVARLLAD
jgi:hypothetical protein